MNRRSRLLKNPLILVAPIVLALLVAWQQFTLAQPQLSVPHSNILPNASLDELDSRGFPIGWQLSRADAAVTATSVKGHNSPSALMLKNASETIKGNTTLTSPIAAVQTGERYFYKAFYKSDVSFDLILRTNYVDGTHDQILVTRYDPNTQWETASHVFVAQENVQSIQFVHSFAGKGQLQIDNTYLEPNPPDVLVEEKPTLVSNLIQNPALSSGNAEVPDGWSKFAQGTNAANLQFMTIKGVAFLRSEVTDYQNGEAKWQHSPIAVKAGQAFWYDVSYQSDTSANVVAEYTHSSGMRQFEVVKELLPAKEWTKYSGKFEIPAGAQDVMVTVVQQKNGRVDTKDFGLFDITKPGELTWDKPRVSFTFDDGWESSYTNGAALLGGAGYKGTFYLNPSTIDTDNFMSSDQVATLTRNGHEIGSHGYEHMDFTTLDRAGINYQFEYANDYFKKIHNAQQVNFAAPFGGNDAQTMFYAKKYYSSLRGTLTGINTKQNFNPYNLSILYVGASVTMDKINAALADAKAKNGWLILVYHRVEPTGNGETIIHPAQFQRHIDTVKNSGVTAMSVHDVLQEISSQ